MILFTTSQSLVIFGVEKVSSYLVCEVVLYAEGLPKQITVTDKETGDKLVLITPKQIQNSLLPGIAADLTFMIA